jgi:cyclopropane fatty-acyl-phospholipid synthase-like methyltransferase
LKVAGLFEKLRTLAIPNGDIASSLRYLRSLAGQAQAKLPWQVRLKAWWEGYDLESWLAQQMAGQSTSPSQADTATPPVETKERPLWSTNRIGVVEQIWGKGFATPGAHDHIPYLVKPFGMNPAMSVLDLGAGLGGAARLMVEEYGAWITGMEPNKVLAEAGMDRSIMAGMAKQAPISHYDPETFTLRQRFDCVFAKETFFTVEQKARLFEVVINALKPRGQLLFTDYVRDADHGAEENIFTAWAAHEPARPHIWQVKDYESLLNMRGLDIRTVEDITDVHKKLILNAWGDFSSILKQKRADKGTMAEMFFEAELWARRIMVLERGLRVYRFYAIKPADSVN